MNSRDEDIAKAIRQRNLGSIVAMFFETGSPTIKSGFKTETELWDYKSDVPYHGNQNVNAWANLAKDVLAFHNNRGGILVFGIKDDFQFCGATVRIDSKLLNDKLRRFLPDTLWIEFHREFIQPDQRYLGLAMIPPKVGPLLRFIADAPTLDGTQLFSKGWAAIREGDSSRVLTSAETEEINRKTVRLHLGQRYYADVPGFKVPSPDYVTFIHRELPCKSIEAALCDPRTSVAQIIGIGGVGKTALATWATIRAYEDRDFDFIISCTAKDRELTTTGIASLQPEFTSFDTLLDTIADVLQYTEYKTLEIGEKESKVRALIKNSGILLYVDNLETVDDARIVQFLDTLPIGVRALVTSRRLTVKVATYPITLGPMDDNEMVAFVRSLHSVPSCSYVTEMSNHAITKIGNACDHIPLAIRWVLSKSRSGVEAMRESDSILAAGKQGEELLEFSFRRVFEQMSPNERSVLEVLSLFSRAQPTEVLLVGSGLKLPELQDVLSLLIDDAIVHRVFDANKNDDCYSMLSITRAFVYNVVSNRQGCEAGIRSRLRDYFEARDIKNPEDRVVIRAVRQNVESSDTALIDLAISARRRGDLGSAQDLLNQAVSRNPRSSRAYRELAELFRHEFNNIGSALQNYEQASANAPKDAYERSNIFREWGILLRDSGQVDAASEAERKLESAYKLNNRDIITITALAQLYAKRGAYLKVIEICEPRKNEVYGKSKEYMLPILLRAYTETDDLLKAAEVKDRLRG